MPSFRHNKKPFVLIGAFVAGLAVAVYPIIIAPYINPRHWREVQQVGREGIDRKTIQPGGMKIWTDPFDRKKE